MFKKRIIGVITIYNNLAVQSFSYSKILPLGNPKILLENLDRWNTDEIIILDFSVTKENNSRRSIVCTGIYCCCSCTYLSRTYCHVITLKY